MPFLARSCFFLVLASLFAPWAHSQDEEPRPAVQARLAGEGLILDIVRAGERYVAVGERGHVLLSGDGLTWTQADHVPVQATLTRVAFADGSLWAVGHDSAIIHSRDMGKTWSLQHFEPEWQRPLLDVHFFDANEGIAIGAYGLVMKTTDAGGDWEVLEMADLAVTESIDWGEVAHLEDEFDDLGFDEYDDELYDDMDDDYYDAESDFDRGCYEFKECHLNAILDLRDGRLMIAAERGYGYRSLDNGETWDAFRFPYPGSMFGLLPVNDSILAFGLRGNVQRSDDFGDSWELLNSRVESTLMGGTLNADGQAVIVGVGSTILVHRDNDSFDRSEDRLGSDYAAVLFTRQNRMMLAGEDGLTHE